MAMAIITRRKLLAAVYIGNRQISPATWQVFLNGKAWGIAHNGIIDESVNPLAGKPGLSVYASNWQDAKAQLEDYLSREGAGQ